MRLSQNSEMDIKPSLRIVSALQYDMGKRIQLYIRDIPLLVVGNPDYFHGVILDQILEESGIPFKRKTFIDSDPHAETRGEGYVVAGMGMADLYKIKEHKVFLSGKSMSYELTPNQEHLDRLRVHMPDTTFVIL